MGIGTHFSDIDTGGWTLHKIPSKTKLIHIDVDSSEIARVYATEVGIVSDARLALTALTAALKKRQGEEPQGLARPDCKHGRRRGKRKSHL